MIEKMKKYRINYFESETPIFKQLVDQGYVFPKIMQIEFKQLEEKLKSIDKDARSGFLTSKQFKKQKQEVHMDLISILIENEDSMITRKINTKKRQKEKEEQLANIKSSYEIQVEIFSYQDEYSKQMERQGFPKINDKTILSELVELEKGVSTFSKMVNESEEENLKLMSELFEEVKVETKDKVYQLCAEYLSTKEHLKQIGKVQMEDKLPGIEIANIKESFGTRESNTNFIFPKLQHKRLGPVLSALSEDYNIDIYGEKDLVKAEALLSQLTLAYNQHEKGSISKEEINSLKKVAYEVLCRIVERNN